MSRQKKLEELIAGILISLLLGLVPLAFCLSFLPYVFWGRHLGLRRTTLGSFRLELIWQLLFSFLSSSLISYLSLLNFCFVFSPVKSGLKNSLLNWLDFFLYNFVLEHFSEIFLLAFLLSFALQTLSFLIIYRLFCEKSYSSEESVENFEKIFSKAGIAELKKFIS